MTDKPKGPGRPKATAPKTSLFKMRCTPEEKQDILERGSGKWVLRMLAQDKKAPGKADG